MKPLFIVLLTFGLTNSYAQKAPDLLWLKSAGGKENDGPLGITSDVNGNVYITVYYVSHTIKFDSIVLHNADSASFSGAGTYDIFIAKYDQSGNVVWARREGGTSRDEGQAITTDASGNIYLCATFWSRSITIGKTTLYNSDTTGNTSNVLIAKYDANGNPLWAKSAQNGLAYPIASDGRGHIYLAGWFMGKTIAFGKDTLYNSNPSGVSEDAFLVKYDTGGNVIWARSGDGNMEEDPSWISIDKSGNIFETGVFYSSVCIFGMDTLYNTSKSGTHEDIYIIKYDSLGNVLWAKSSKGKNDNNAYTIVTDANGNAYINGSFSSNTLTFGNKSVHNCDSSHVNMDMYIAKYDKDGNAIWVRSAGGKENDYFGFIAIDANGHLYITGTVGSTVFIWNKDTLYSSNVSNSYPDVFLAKCDTSGNIIWFVHADGDSLDWGGSLALDLEGNLFMTGGFRSPKFSFEKESLTNKDIICKPYSTSDVFIAKINSSVGTIEISQKKAPPLTIYPNPTTKQFTIQLPVPDADITITDDIGRQVLHTKATGNKAILQLDNAGLYFIQVQSGTQRITQKLVVIKN